MQYQLINPGSNITINKPVQEVWKKLTKNGEKYTWINDESYITSSWKNGEPIVWKTSEGEDYYRGYISEIIEQKSISFTIHNAFEEDHLEPDEQPDWNNETWKISFEDNGDSTKLTLQVLDYDSDHNEEDHNHTETITNSKEVAENIIPKMLLKIKAYCE